MFLPNSFIDTTKYFGISISSSSIKAVSLNKDGQIDSYAQHPLSQDVLNGQVDNPEAFISALNKIKTDGNFESTYASVVLPEKFAFSKEFTSPKISIPEINEAISWQIDDIFPFSTEEIYFDWKLISQDEKEVKALVVSMQKKLIDSIRSSLAKSELYPISFEPAISALSRISNIKNDTFTILLDIDQLGVTSSLIKNEVSLLTTTNPNSQNQQIINTIQLSIQSLLNFYQEKFNNPLEQYSVIITGDLAENNLLTSINSQLQIKAQILNIEGISPPFHKAYAAAASNILPPESEKTINLLPKDLNQWYQDHYHQKLYRKTSRYLFGVLAASAIVTASSLGLLYYTQNSMVNSGSTPAANQTSEGVNPQQLLKTANQINKLFPQKVGPQEELETALASIPDTVRVEGINFDAAGNKIQMYGSFEDRQGLLDFKDNLEATNLFHKINLPLGSLTNQEDSTFSIEFSIKPQE